MQVSFHYNETTSTTSTTWQSYSQLPLIHLERTRPLIFSLKKLTRPQHHTRCPPFQTNQEKEPLSGSCHRSIGTISRPIPPTYLPPQPQPWTLCNSQLTTHTSGRRKDTRLTPSKPANHRPAPQQRLSNASTPHKRTTGGPASATAPCARLNAAVLHSFASPPCALLLSLDRPSLFRAPRSRGAAHIGIRGVA
jgi:hypothetical protein